MKTIKKEKYVEYRCRLNNALLFKAKGKGQVEIMNQKNRYLNYLWPNRPHQDQWPKGIQFAQKCFSIHCPWCKRLLCKAIGSTMEIEIKCNYCKTVSTHSLYDLAKKKMINIPLAVLNRDYGEDFVKEIKAEELRRSEEAEANRKAKELAENADAKNIQKKVSTDKGILGTITTWQTKSK